MKIHNVKQGSAAWLALRAAPNTFTASEASAMMGASKYQTRTELLQQKHTGVTPDVDAVTQSRFQDGHDTEAQFLPVAERIIGGDDLSPVTGTIELDGMILLASFDGLTFDRSTAYEHKLFNAGVARDIEAYGEPGPHYFWQMEHQLLVSGGQRVLFATSNGREEGSVTCFYESKPERRAQLIAGWKQFAKDLAEFVPLEVIDKPVAQAVTALPAVMVQITGELAVRDNFELFERALRDFIDNRLIREPSTDQEFADLDQQIKALKNAEATLDAAEAQMLAQVSTVDTIKRTKDMLHKLARDNRLMAEKLLEARKLAIKGEIVAEGVNALRKHVEALNERLGKPYMPAIPADFGAAVKNRRTVDSLREAMKNELTRAKIAASEIADRVQLNLNYLREHAKDYIFLFADTPTIVLKAPEDLQMVVKSRITEHEQAEQKRLDEQREQIRKEEAARLEREADEKRRADEAEAQRKADEAIKTAATPAPAAAPAATVAPLLSEKPVADQNAREFVASVEAKGAANLAAAGPATGTMPRSMFDRTVAVLKQVAEPDEKPSMKLGVITERLGFTVTADFLETLGFVAHVERGSRLYRPSDFPRICEALIQHITTVADEVPA
jgi:predicted phage-related endonuclease